MALWNIKEIYNLQRSNDWILKGDRCVFAGGYASSSNQNIIDFISAAAGGTAADFGDLTAARGTMQDNYGTLTRGIIAGGANLNTIDFVTIATTGNAADFGDLTQTRRYVAGGGNTTRGIYGGGISPNPSNGHYNIIEFLTGASLGNAADFGDLTQSLERLCSLSSPTRQIWAAGSTPGDNVQNTIQSVQTATMGNATDFGDLGTAKYGPMGVSNGIRGLVCGGNAGAPGHADFNHIEFITFATTGNAADFGDLTGSYLASGSASGTTRGLVGHDGGATGLDMITISTTGNATDFADISVARSGYAGVSNGHGGLNLDDVQRPSATYMPGSGRTLIFGGNRSGGDSLNVDMFHVTTLGNASDFGDLSRINDNNTACASVTRGICDIGAVPSDTYNTHIDSIEFQSQGNSADFGDATVATNRRAGFSSTTRGVFSGGSVPDSQTNVIDFITIASASNATDFGDSTVARQESKSFSSLTRGVVGGGYTGSYSDVIDYVTIASAGNATDFGNLTAADQPGGGLSNSVRGLFGGGDDGGGTIDDEIQYVTIASTGNTTDFGDLTQARNKMGNGSTETRGCFAGGQSPTLRNTIDYVTIASTGNAADFGDLTDTNSRTSGTSDAHGGLQG
tara:strand:+ start:943 stop:2817 length:1875 start_codon:yes stop_codon:yes gene_type:complete